MTGQNIVPFGKYKDRPAADMIADTAYCEWLVAQPWFKEKYANVYNLVINYGPEPQDTPEHNALQARFLDLQFCASLARSMGHTIEACRDRQQKDEARWLEKNAKYVEQFGYDVIERIGKVDRLRFENIFDVTFYVGNEVEIQVLGPTRDSYFSTASAYCNGGSFGVECKPAIGDDYPAVLRQVLAQKARPVDRPSNIAVVYDTLRTTNMAVDQVYQIFALSGIKLVSVAQIEARQ